MTTSHFAALAAALLFSAAAVSAQAAATDTPAVAPATQPAPLRAAQNAHDPNQVICRHDEEIGTRLGGQKTCRTRADWDNISRKGADYLNDIQASGAHSNPSGH